jgi:predicted dienelactone hydrolase
MYPTQVPSHREPFGPYSMDVSPDAPPDGGLRPLVVISHGGGSTPLVLRTIGSYLAKNGFVVALPEHPGNNRRDNSLENTIENLEHRPRHISLAIDTVISDPDLAGHMLPDEVAVIGHSLGGYTALAVAGGQPWSGMDQPIRVTPDTRIKALVLLAPATGWFVPNHSLRNVRLPILLLIGEHDHITPRWQAQLVLDLVPDRDQVTFRVIENAGHFSFLSPFPPAMQSAGLPPAMDPEGFDRKQFHEQLHEQLRAFLNQTLRHL